MKSIVTLGALAVLASGFTSCKSKPDPYAQNPYGTGSYPAYDPAQGQAGGGDYVSVSPVAPQTDYSNSGAYAPQQPAYNQGGYQQQAPAYQPQAPVYQPQAPAYQPQAPAYQPTTPVSGANATRSYTVAKGDTLYSISRRAGTSVDVIKQTNGLTSDLIYPGDVLLVP